MSHLFYTVPLALIVKQRLGARVGRARIVVHQPFKVGSTSEQA